MSWGGANLKNLRFTGYGEPLLNPHIPDMIADAKKRALSSRLELTTNASLLTPALSDRIIDAGLTRLLISIQGLTPKNYKEMSDYSLEEEVFLKNIRYFYEHRGNCTVYIKIMDAAVPLLSERESFYEIYGPLCDMMAVESMINAYEGVDYEAIAHKNIDHANRYGYEVDERICCDTLFMYMTIDSKGDVDVCGCTYPAAHIGNIKELPLAEIWNGTRHKKLMLMHLSGRRKEVATCKRCHSITSYAHPLDNLDGHLEELYTRIQQL